MFLERRTRTISRCQLLAAVAQILLCLVLVPADRVHGAAWALSGGSLVLVVLLWRHYRRSTVSIELALFRTALATAPCLAVAWIVSMLVPSPPPFSVLALAAAVVGASYVLFASLFRVLSDAERRWFRPLMVRGGRRVPTFLAGRCSPAASVSRTRRITRISSDPVTGVGSCSTRPGAGCASTSPTPPTST